MKSIGSKLRAEAAEQRAAASLLIKSDDLKLDIQKQIAAVVGLTTANVFDAIADLADTLRATAPTDPMTVRRQEMIARSDAVRRAAALASASGDWTHFDKLTGTDGGT